MVNARHHRRKTGLHDEDMTEISKTVGKKGGFSLTVLQEEKKREPKE